ncbi:MAG: sulfite exporter TauE/SafE family protein [Dokdonia sp.]|uniref:urease accessory protein UreH domain-containing protein n=1 Tax=Flavobacteriaceae TaxID=49546 RepID=UPI001AFF185D|nr:MULTISPECIES: sulfite exporter TauE/SafE family protein [Flavobacteriaceae]MBO6881649.1 sulfite exporter TauE/SafE family protein [Winogradskyella sp.]
MITTLFSAILASILHVISGPDHLAAVTPLAISSQRKGWKIGLVWGIGHLLGMLLIGILFLLFKEVIPVDAISAYSEQLVAIVLIVVGLWAFYRIFKEKKKHHHPHTHSDGETHIHTYTSSAESHTHKKKIKQNTLSSLGIGFLHGLAGVAHFILLLPVLAFDTKLEGIQYIIGFAIGTVLAMTVYALILGSIASYSKKANDPIFFKGIRFAGGLFAVVIGIYWLYLTF